MTTTKRIKKILAVILMILMIFNGNGMSINGNIVKADEETESNNERDFVSGLVSSDGNIYNMEKGDYTDVKRRALEKALEDDPRVQYLLTYSFLENKFGVTNSNSSYAGVYIGTMPRGVETSLTLKTNPEVVAREVEMGEEGEIQGSPRDLPKEEDLQKNDKKRSEATRDLGVLLSSELTVLLSGVFTGNMAEVTKDNERGIREFLTSGIHEELLLDLKKVFGVEEKNKWELVTNRGTTAPVGLKKEFDRLVVTSMQSNEDIKNIDEIVKEITKNISYEELRNVANKLRKNELGDGYDPNKSNYIFYVHGAGFAKKKAYIKKNVLNAKSRTAYLSFFPEIIDVESYLTGVTKEEYIKELRKVAGKELKTSLKSKYSNYVDRYLSANKQARENDVHVARDKRIVGWVPLYINIDKEELVKTSEAIQDRLLEDTFNKLLEEEKSVYHSEGYISTSNGNPRTLRVVDLFYSDKSTNLLVLDTDNTKNNYAKLKIGRKTDNLTSGTSIGKYAGIRTTIDDGFFRNVGIHLRFVGDHKTGVSKNTSSEDGYNVRVFRNLAANTDSIDMDLDVTKDLSIGIDTYGNIIAQETGTILIPYWQNEVVTELGVPTGNNAKWVSHAAFNDVTMSEIIKQVVDDVDKEGIKENNISTDEILNVFGPYGITNNNIGQDAILSSNVSLNHQLFTSDDSVRHHIIHNLALKIVAGTHEQVREFNKKAREWGKESQELHIKLNANGYGSGLAGINEDGLYTNADLRERIMYILDYGFFDVMRLTLSALIVFIYNTDFLNYSLSSVFYTQKITDSAVWDDIMVSLGFWIIGLLGIYIVYMAFQVFRRVMTVKDFIQQFLIVSLVILIPSVVYSPLIELIINKPTPMIVGKQMQQMAILDYYDELREEVESVDPAYAQLFGGKLELREKGQDYIIEFYTTQHKNGYDITQPSAAQDRGIRDQIRSSRAEITGEWNKNDVVKVNVSMFDLFKWARERDEGETELELFEWLVTADTVGSYEGIGSYREFHYDPNRIIRNLGILQDNNFEDLKTITASELFLKLYEQSNPKEIDGRFLGEKLRHLNQIAKMAKHNDPKSPVAMEEVEALIRDLSLTKEGRLSAYGNRAMDTNVIQVVTEGYDEPAVSVKTEELLKRLQLGSVLTIGEGDYFNLENIIDEVRPETGDPREKTNDRLVYDINEKVLNDYVNVHYTIRNSVGDIVDKSEFMVVVLNLFFRLNDVVGIPMFPTEIKPDTYSLDTYVRMVYIPVAEYKNSEDAGISNLAEYLTLRDNPFVLLIFFLPALVLLVFWGILYLIVFGFLMVLLTTISFVWNYVIKNRKENRSWLGVLIVIFTFAVAKLGLLLLWYGMSYIMNEMYNNYGGLTYGYTFIHSLIIIAYILIAYEFMFKKVLMNLAKDPVNIGGEKLITDFADGFNNTLRRFTGANTDTGTKTKEKERSVDKQLNNEGEDGQVKESLIGTGIRRAVDAAKAETMESVKDLGNIAKGLFKPANSRFLKHYDGISGRLKNNLFNAYDDIEGTIGTSGLGTSLVKGLAESGVVGQVISSTLDGETLTVLDVGNREAAKYIRKYLKSKGIKAEINSNDDVVFNSTGKDLEDGFVRKNLFGGMVEGLLKDLESIETANIKEVDDDDVINYTINKDGVITIPVGSTGLSTKGLGTIINSKEFSDAFVIQGEPQVDANGNYIAGSLDVIPKGKIDVEKVLGDIYSKDEKHREFIGDEKRELLGLTNAVSLTDIHNRDDIQDLLEDGMVVQKDKILYDYTNQKHVNAVMDIMDKLSTIDDEYRDKRKLMDKAVAYVVKGENHGFKTKQFNTIGDEQIESYARGVNLLADNVETLVHAGTEVENVVQNLKMFNNLRNVDVKTLNDYYKEKDNLYRIGEELFLSGKGSRKYDTALDKLAKAGLKAGANEEGVNKILEKYKVLGEDLNSANMMQDEYEKEVEKLFNDLQVELQDQGLFSKVITTAINQGKNVSEKYRDTLNKYVSSKRNITKKGLSADFLDKVGEDEFRELVEIVRDVEGVKDIGDGVIKLETSQELTDEVAAKIIAKFSKNRTK